jgi:hypothetical protein
MASLLDMAQARLQGLLDLPARAGRALVDPTVFSGLLGAPTLPKERGIAQAAYGLPPEPNMSVLNPEQAAYMQGYAQGEPLSYLGLLAPFTAPAAVAGAKAVAPQAGMALENYMARQGLIQPLTAYHGTPHTIQGQFDINKVGTGEGAQAYGHGMYFAESPEVAQTYVTATNPSARSAYMHLQANNGNIAETIKEAAKDVKRMEENQQFLVKGALEQAKEKLSFLQSQKAGKPIQTGNLYKVDIPDADIPFMLDYDKPLKDQTPQVQKALAVVNPKFYDPKSPNYDPNESGKWIYMSIAGNITPEAQKVASAQLNALGIKGIRYLDEGSRAKGKGTSNYVVFDPTDVNILEKNSQKVEGLLD